MALDPISFDRRTLLSLAAGGSALAASGVPLAAGAASSGAGGRERTIRKALKIGMLPAGTLAERFALAKRCGFDGVELDSPSDLDPDEVLRARDRAGIAIPGVVDSRHWQDNLGSADAEMRARGRAALETAIEDCARYGGTTVLLVPAVVTEDVPYDQAWENAHAEIAAVLPLAAERAVTIAFENVWNRFLLSPLEAARWVDSFESPHVGWYLDVGNLVNFGYPAQWARILGDRVVKLDVKGYSRTRRDERGPWAGFEAEIGAPDDDGGWPEVMSALAPTAWTGWASAEVRGGDATRLRDVAERMERVLSS